MSEREKYIAKTKGGKNTMSTEDAKVLKLVGQLQGASSGADKLKIFKKLNDVFEDVKGIPSDADMKMLKKSVPGAKAGGLMEATAKLKAKGFSEGGAVVKDKTVAIDKSPNSGLITQRGFGASRRT